MATIYKRKKGDGTYSYYINLTINGKRIRKYAGISMSTAFDTLKRLEYEELNSDFSINKCLPYKKVIKMYIEYISGYQISSGQLKLINSKVNKFLNYCSLNGINKLHQISTKDSMEYMNLRSRAVVQVRYNSYKDNIYNRLQPSTLNRDISFLKRFFNYCINMDLIVKNPFRNIKKYKVHKSRQRYYFKENDIKLIFATVSKFTDFYKFLLYTGIRPTDAYKLKHKHVRGSYLSLKMSKTGDLLRIPLSSKVIAIVNKRCGGKYVFYDIQSDRQKRNCLKNIQKLYKPDFIRKNNITLHTFRHTYAHNMLNKGVPKEVLQTLLGHRSIKTTEIYANWVNIKEVEKYV